MCVTAVLPRIAFAEARDAGSGYCSAHGNYTGPSCPSCSSGGSSVGYSSNPNFNFEDLSTSERLITGTIWWVPIATVCSPLVLVFDVLDLPSEKPPFHGTKGLGRMYYAYGDAWWHVIKPVGKGTWIGGKFVIYDVPVAIGTGIWKGSCWVFKSNGPAKASPIVIATLPDKKPATSTTKPVLTMSRETPTATDSNETVKKLALKLGHDGDTPPTKPSSESANNPALKLGVDDDSPTIKHSSKSGGKIALKLSDDDEDMKTPGTRNSENGRMAKSPTPNTELARDSGGKLALKLDDDDLKPLGSRASSNSGVADSPAPNTEPMVVDLRDATRTSIDPALLKNGSTIISPNEVLRDAVADTQKGKPAVVPVNEETQGYLEKRLLDQLSQATTPEEKAALEVKYAHLLLGKADKQGASAAWQRAMTYNSPVAIQAEHNFQAVMQQPISPAQNSGTPYVPLTPFAPNRNAKVQEGAAEAAKVEGENKFFFTGIKKQTFQQHWQESPPIDPRLQGNLDKYPAVKQNLEERAQLVVKFQEADPKDPNNQAEILKQVEVLDNKRKDVVKEIITRDFSLATDLDNTPPVTAQPDPHPL